MDEVRPVTALFADVVGSTSLGERLGPEEIRALIGECVSRVCETVESFGGEVGALMGDGVAAFFGLEAAIEDDVDRAVRAGLEILEVIDRYGDEVRAAWGIDDFSVRVGINQGRVGVGSVGGSDPQTVALGDPVNVAARLQGAARPGTLVVGRSVADHVATLYEIADLGPIRVKGRTAPVEAFEVIRSGRKRGSRDWIFVGRLNELDRLDSVVRDLQEGRGQVSIITGDGGIGKTRLIEELRRRVPSELLWLDAHCDPVDHRTPYQAFAEPLRAWLGLDERATPIEVRVRLISRGKPLLEDSYQEVAPYLARLLGVSLDSRGDRRLDGFSADLLTAKLLTAYAEWIAALSEAAPVILAIDNLDGVAGSTAEFVDSLLSVVQRAQVLLIISMRPAPSDPGWQVRGRALAELSQRTTTIDLKPLSVREADELIAAVDRDDSLTANLRAVVRERAEGNPLYIAELVGAMTDLRGESDLPRALETLLLSRIDALPPEHKAVLQAAAVLGRVFRADVLHRMGVVSDPDRSIAALLGADVIRERGRRPVAFAFRHGLVRDAALTTLTSTRFRELNRLAACALSESGTDEEQDVETLARCYLASGKTAEAVRCYERLAGRLEMVFRYEEAARALNECLEHGDISAVDRCRLTLQRAGLLVHLRRFDTALEALRLAEAATSSPSELAEVALVRASTLFELNRIAEARVELANCMELGEANEVGVRAAILDGRIALELGDLETARERASQASLDELNADVAFEAASLHAGVAASSGALDDAESWALRSQQFADLTGRLTHQLAGKRHLALICMLKGYAREAFELMRSVHHQYAAVGDQTGRVETAVNLAYLALLTGELDEGAEAARSALEVAGLGPPGLLLRVNLALLEIERGNLEIAAGLVRKAFEIAPCATALLALATVETELGDLESAVLRLNAAESNEPVEPGIIEAARAEIAFQRGDFDLATELAAAALGAIPISDPALSVCVRRQHAEAQLKSSGGADFSSIAIDANRMGLRLQEAYALLGVAETDSSNAEAHRRRAQLIFEQCGCRRGLRELEARRERALTTSQN